MNTNIQGDFQICISVPSKYTKIIQLLFFRFLLISQVLYDFVVIPVKPNPLMLGGNKKVTHTQTNLHLFVTARH